jgi:uncharacterized protein YjiS (DUF1127 family)
MPFVRKVYAAFFDVSIFIRRRRRETGHFESLWGAVMRARRISRERGQLLEMSARMLADIGLSPGDAQMEGSRSFWDIPASKTQTSLSCDHSPSRSRRQAQGREETR